MLRTCVVRLPASRLTLSVRSFHVPATPGTIAWPPSLPSVPTSRATRVTSEANERSWSTMVLMASLSCRISPRTSTVIFLERSPFATAIVTSAMLRTCAVRFDAIELTFSVKSFQTPVTSLTCAWPPSLPSVPTSRATRVTSEVNTLSCLIMVLTMFAARRNSPCRGRPSTSSGTVCNKSPFATAEMARVTSLVGQSRSSMRVLTEVSISAHDLADPFELLRHALIGGDDFVEGVGDLAQQADLTAGHADREIPHAHGLQRIQKIVELGRCAAIDRAIGHFRGHRAGRRAVGLEFADRLGVPWHGFLQARMNSHDVTGAALSRGHPAISGRVSRNAADGKWGEETGPEVPGPPRASGRAPHAPGAGDPPIFADEYPPTGWLRPCAYNPRCIPRVGAPPDAPNATAIQSFRAN